MTRKEFNGFLHDEIIPKIMETFTTKASDYSAEEDQLYNFKIQARLDDITPIEALRGNHLKHRASIIQGLDELSQGKIRPFEWWLEKVIDNINYNILLLALIKEETDMKIEVYKN